MIKKISVCHGTNRKKMLYFILNRNETYPKYYNILYFYNGYIRHAQMRDYIVNKLIKIR